jgi:hypothetical protein
MQVGTEILLARMKEYPEEFIVYGYDSRWGNLIDDAKHYLPKEDVEALDEGYRQLRVDQFNERVLARLAGEDKQQQPEETMTIKASGRYTTGLSDPRALAQTQLEYEQAVKQAQHNADMQQRAMNAAQQNQYASGLQNSLYNGGNGSSIGDWLTGGHK